MLILPLNLVCPCRSRPEPEQTNSVKFRSKHLSIACLQADGLAAIPLSSTPIHQPAGSTDGGRG